MPFWNFGGIGWLEVVLICLIIFLIYKIFLTRHIDRFLCSTPQLDFLARRLSLNYCRNNINNELAALTLKPLKRRDMTVDQLLQYDGVKNEDKRICIAVDGKIFDVTKSSNLYGKSGPYGIFAGHDASRGLATFSTTPDVVRDTYDDLFNLAPSEIGSMREWAAQMREKYPFVGRLLKPGEQPDLYSDDEEANSQVVDGIAAKKSE